MQMPILLTICFSLLVESVHSHSQQAETFIQTIPKDDKQKLEELFYGFVHQDHFGYALFGDKPVAISGHCRQTHWENFLSLHENEGTFWEAWKTWETYYPKLSFHNFLLYKEPSPFVDGSLIVLINKNAFLNSVREHAPVFEKILQAPISPEEFLRKIETGQKTLMESIEDNVTLLGILLGYGKQNAILFSQKKKILHARSLQAYHQNVSSLSRIPSLDFMADLNSQETQKLHFKYSQTRAQLASIYAAGNFFSISLARLIEKS